MEKVFYRRVLCDVDAQFHFVEKFMAGSLRKYIFWLDDQKDFSSLGFRLRLDDDSGKTAVLFLATVDERC